MSELAQQLTGRMPAVLDRVRQIADRLRVNPAAYRAGSKGLWVFSAVMIVLMGLLPLYAPSGKVLLAQQSLYLGLLALSLNLLVATTGLISFGQAMFYGFGAYMVAVPFAKLGWSPLWGLALAPLIGAVAAFFIGLIVFRGRELYFALLTLGVGQLVWATAHGWQSLTGGTNGTTGVFGPDWLNPFQHQNQLYWFIFGCTAFCALILYIITHSPFGDALRGIRENRRRAEFTGLWVWRYELTAFMIAGMFGAVAGGLAVIGETQIASGQIDWQKSALALIVALIGGIRYFLGPFAGAIFYLFVFDYVIAKTELWDTVLGVVVLVVALAFPSGIGGGLHWLFAQFAAIFGRVGRGEDAEQAQASPEELEAVHLPKLEPEAAATAARGNDAGPPVLVVKGLTKSFGGLVAVDGASFSVRPRSIHAIIGPNGAGKTTLFNLISGLLKPDRGEVSLEGEDVTGVAPWRLVKRGVGRSFQQTNLFWALSSLDNVTLADAAVKDSTRKMWGGHAPETRKRAGALLDRIGLGQFGSLTASELSHGDQRSLEIATALAVESRLLLLDEPTAGLSPTETRTAVALIRRIAHEQELTVLFVEHDMEVVFGIADRITVLHRGAVLAEGTPAEIRANLDVQRAYLGEIDDDQEVGA